MLLQVQSLHNRKPPVTAVVVRRLTACLYRARDHKHAGVLIPLGSNRWGPVGGVIYRPSPLDRSDLRAQAGPAPRHLIKARADFGLDGKLPILQDRNDISYSASDERLQMLVPGLER